MYSGYQPRRGNADRYLPAQKAVLSRFTNVPVNLIQTGSFEDDTEHATDFILPNGCRISARVRSAKDIANYYGEFTIRKSGDRNGKSEWDKIKRGDCRYQLYSFAGEGDQLQASWLLDLSVLVDAERSAWTLAQHPVEIRVNDAWFFAFRIDGYLSFPPLVLGTDQKHVGNSDRLLKLLN